MKKGEREKMHLWGFGKFFQAPNNPSLLKGNHLHKGNP
jgi:hypothetical protein